MATATTTPPPMTPSPPRSIQRKPLQSSRRPSGQSQTGAAHEDDHQGSMGIGRGAAAPIIRHIPSSSGGSKFQSESQARLVNSNIENGQYVDPINSSSRNRVLPISPQAPPPPPPHNHIYAQLPLRDTGPSREHNPADPYPQTELRNNARPENMITPEIVRTKTDGSYSAYVPEQYGGGTQDMNPSHDGNRESRESDTVASTRLQTSTESSVETSASSVSGGLNEPPYGQVPGGVSSKTSLEGATPEEPSVPRLEYHHQQFMPRVSSVPLESSGRDPPTPDGFEGNMTMNRHLTPNSFYMRRSSMPRPQSAYSVNSDLGPRGHSPGMGGAYARAPSQNRRSPDNRLSSYGELLNISYPQPAPAPITFDNSHLRDNVGMNASLLSTQKTLEMYRQNVKKTNDFSIQYSFAVFLISTAQEQGLEFDESSRKKSGSKQSPGKDGVESSPTELIREAKSILTRLASGGYPFAQYYLADGYASGLFNKGKEDYSAAFPLFVLAAKHGHAESAYRAGLCYEFGWGCRKDPAKAVQFLRTAASKNHPGAMTRLGKACLSGDLGENRYREGIKWLKRATESADVMYNSAPYQLGTMYETGFGDDIFKDESYAAELFTQAAELGHPEAGFRMGDAYEHGKLNCPRDPALSVHFYTGAAERGHAGAMMGLCAWYLVGAEPILEKDEEEAYEWARRSAELDFVKAQYAVGYFTEMGIGCRRDMLEANVWYVKAADAGDERAKQRLEAIRVAASGGTPMEVAPAKSGKMRKTPKEEKECIVM
ncbi:HCP-like protein [Poronia punctata]|nr:HCP-like protein [Poronia punctata]